MIELRNYKHMHVSRARSSKRMRPSQSGGGGGGGACLRDKNPAQYLAPEEGVGRLFEGGV